MHHLEGLTNGLLQMDSTAVNATEAIKSGELAARLILRSIVPLSFPLLCSGSSLMVPDLFREESSSARSHFTFSNPKLHGGRSDGGNSSDGSDYMAWAERIKGDRGGYFGRSHGRSVGAWTRRSSATPLMMSSPRYVRHGWWSAEQLDEDEDDGYGTPSPPLWKNPGNSPTIRSASSSPRHSRRAGPTARAQEISRYRQEMLELVRGLPESDYELSLRDMVEGIKLLGQEQESQDGEIKSTTKGKIRSERKETAPTGGLLLGMRFPFSVGDRRKRRLSASRENKSGLGGIGSNSNSSTGSSSSSSSTTTTTTTTIATTSNNRRSSRNKQTRRMSNCYCFFERNAAGDMD